VDWLVAEPRINAKIAWLALFVAVGCVGASARQPRSVTTSAWREITTEHFVIDTDLSDSEVTWVVRLLEQGRNVMIHAGFGGEPPPQPRTRVFALRRDEFHHFDRSTDGAFVRSIGCGPALVTSGGFDPTLVVHELAHYVSSLYVDLQLQPQWLKEGVAAYLETLSYDEATGHAELGRRPPRYARVRSADLVSFDDLWAWNRFERNGPAREFRLYATSFTTVHYLINHRPEGLVRFRELLNRGTNARAAWREAFPELDTRGFAEVVGRYPVFDRAEIRQVTVPAAPLAMRSHPLGEADARGIHAMLYVAFRGAGGRSVDEDWRLALAEMAASLRVDPASFWAHAVNYCELNTVRASPALARKAVADQQDNWLAWLWYAEVLREAHATFGERRMALSRALEIGPRNQLVLERRTELELDAGNPDGALTFAEKMFQTPPFEGHRLLTYARALSSAGRCEDARAVERALVRELKYGVPEPVQRALGNNAALCAKVDR
jgi:hypothetical protein